MHLSKSVLLFDAVQRVSVDQCLFELENLLWKNIQS